MRGAAAAAMDRGWSVFPVNGKLPATSDGFKSASRDFDLIEEWWPEGTARGIGLATGEVSGVWVLDLDGPDAVDRLLDLQDQHGELPTTITARTSRGRHLYFRMPAEGGVRNSAGKVGKDDDSADGFDVSEDGTGIDVRGTGGYVVIPPSPHPSGAAYAWANGRSPDELTPAPAPAWLLGMVQKGPQRVERSTSPLPPPDAPRSSRYILAAIESECLEVASAGEGTRNETLNRAAFSLSRFATTGEVSTRDLKRALSHAARMAGLPDWEISRTLKSAFRARGAA